MLINTRVVSPLLLYMYMDMDTNKQKEQILRLFEEKGIDLNDFELILKEREIHLKSSDDKRYIKAGEIIHKRGLYQNFCTINQDFLLYIIECKITGTVRRVLDAMLAYMEKDNLANITAAGIAEITKITSSNVSRSIKELKEKKIIYQENINQINRKEKRYKINYSINKNMAVKCRQTDKQYIEYHKKEMKEQAEGLEIPERINIPKGFF